MHSGHTGRSGLSAKKIKWCFFRSLHVHRYSIHPMRVSVIIIYIHTIICIVQYYLHNPGILILLGRAAVGSVYLHAFLLNSRVIDLQWLSTFARWPSNRRQMSSLLLPAQPISRRASEPSRAIRGNNLPVRLWYVQICSAFRHPHHNRGSHFWDRKWELYKSERYCWPTNNNKTIIW